MDLVQSSNPQPSTSRATHISTLPSDSTNSVLLNGTHPRNRRRRPNNAEDAPDGQSSTHALPNRGQPRRGRGARAGRGRGNAAVPSLEHVTGGESQASSTEGSSRDVAQAQRGIGQSRRRRGGGRSAEGKTPETGNSNPKVEHATADHDSAPNDQPSGSRRRQFRSRLTTNPSPLPADEGVGSSNLNTILDSDDLTTRLTHALRTPPYPDCPICFAAIHPLQPIWSCSPSEETSSCCWASFHLKCIKAWASKSTQETRDAYRARDEDRPGEWRCPGCQSKRNTVPKSYTCFCGSVQDPKPGRLATPHSCANSCSRARSSCNHPCPLSCHPGPCPPCLATIQQKCHCGKTSFSLRCGKLSTTSLSCGEPCRRLLSCGKHTCEAVCHPEECEPCSRVEIIRCHCGKQEREVSCGDNEPFDCGSVCHKSYDCGFHMCEEKCHNHTATVCPFDPSVVETCPCGKKLVAVLLRKNRTSCKDPIPTCTSSCLKPYATCSHACPTPCHLGKCPPCDVPIPVTCRCGETIQHIPCSSWQERVSKGDGELLCNKVCSSLRRCGRHTCNRVCCPLAGVRLKGGKGKKKMLETLSGSEMDEMDALWHTCDIVCGRPLACGLHRCSEPDHRGPCPPCLQSTYDELVCRCGRTRMLPPIPCNTQIKCSYPCDRPPPPCGHPPTVHSCHETGECPPCPFLVSKSCACGKTTVSNVRCSQDKVSCGKPCGRPLICGFHTCPRLCHSASEECGDCTQVCGKSRKLCLPANHPCTLPCHAPTECPEDEPCKAMITVTCSCGRMQQPATCGISSSKPVAKEIQQLKCTSECAIMRRNAKLAEALGITPSAKERNNVVYSDDLQSFAKANHAFCLTVEKAFSDFIRSDKRTQILPPMPPARRKFVHDLAEVYRMDNQAVDEEPKRSIQLIRRIDSRIPSPLLSSLTQPTNNLGRLADLRSPSPRKAPSPMPTAPATKGWATLLTTSASPQAAQSTASTQASSHRPLTPGRSVPHAVTPVPVSKTQPPESVPDDWEDD